MAIVQLCHMNRQSHLTTSFRANTHDTSLPIFVVGSQLFVGLAVSDEAAPSYQNEKVGIHFESTDNSWPSSAAHFLFFFLQRERPLSIPALISQQIIKERTKALSHLRRYNWKNFSPESLVDISETGGSVRDKARHIDMICLRRCVSF